MAVVAAMTVASCRSTVKDDPTRASASAAPRVITSPRAMAGEASFQKYCALCHGKDARGYAADNAPSLISETFLASASDEFLKRSIREGRPGTAMAGYTKDRGGPLGDDEIASIIAYLREGGPKPLDLPAGPGPGVATRGQAVYDQQCQRCHGTRDARGEAPHLANPNFLAAASDAYVRYAIVNGRPGTKMEPFEKRLDAQSIDDAVAYVRSLAPPAPAPPPPPAPEPPLDMPIVINPNGKPPQFTLREDRFVPADQVKKALDAKARMVVVDARAGSDWNAAHIPGSLPIPYFHLGRLDQIPNDGTWVVAYCACPHHASGAIVDELKKRGYPNAVILDEGILEWQRRKYPVVGADGKPPPAASMPPAPPPPPPRGAPPPPDLLRR
jgi:cytochrome c oxidase cbb3-type subunit 3/ubiquinol-cytochrome c reductase cytochrome c subunit